MLQSCKVAKLQSCKVAKLQRCKGAKVHVANCMLQIACCKLQRTLFGQLKKIRSQTDRRTDFVTS